MTAPVFASPVNRASWLTSGQVSPVLLSRRIISPG